jgi:AcrR family transcriptional regulator
MARAVVDKDVAAGRRAERKAQNRAKLLTAARKIFAEKGVGAATARDIVRETDLATGTFYNYFRDKEDCFQALLDELSEKLRAAVREQRREPGRTLEERIEGAYRAYFELALEERELFRVFRRNVGAVAMMPSDGQFEAGLSELLEDLGEWVEAGDMPGDLDLDYLATALIGIGFQVAAHLVDQEGPDPAAAARFCTTLVMSGTAGFARPSRSGRSRGRAPR